MVDLRVLGRVDLRAPGMDAGGNVLAQPKRLALLVYLASGYPREFRTRDELIELLWPELGAERARAALSQALYFLRKTLGEDLLVTRGNDEIGIHPACIRCDLAELKQARAEGDPSRVLELYRGELLDGMTLVESAPWQDWLRSERERCRSWAADATWELAEKASAGGDAESAIRLAQKAIGMSRDDEVLLRKMLELMDRHGERAAAVRLYEQFRERLANEYGVGLAPETRALYNRILARHKGHSAAPASPRDRPKAPEARRVHRRAWRNGLVLAAVLAAGAWLWLAPGSKTAEDAAVNRVPIRLTIADFGDSSADPELDYLAPGVREDLANRLAGLNRLRVIVQAPGEPVTPPPLAPPPNDERETGYLLTGEIRPGADGLQIHLEVFSQGESAAGWRQKHVAAVGDLRAVSTEIAEWVAGLLLPGLTTRELQRLRSGLPTSDEAFHFYLRGRHLAQRGDAASFQAAFDLFEKALALDPEFARGWSGLADTFIGLAWARALPESVAVPRAREAAERALALDPALAEAHASLADVLNRHFWDSARAEQHFREAIRLEPDNAETHLRFSALLRNTGRLAEAREEVETAIALDPINFFPHFQRVVLDLMDQHYGEAISRSRQLLQLRPDVPMARFLLARSLAENGDFPAALEELEQMPGGGRMPPALTLRGYVLARSGQTDGARRVLRELQSAGERDPDMPVSFDLAVVHVGLGEFERALALLDQAVDRRDYRVRLLAQEPMFRVLDGEPAFLDLLQRAGLAESGSRR